MRIRVVSSQALLAAGIPNARLQIIERAGHNPQTERPAETVAVVAEFLTAAPALAATPALDAAVQPPAPAGA